MDNLKKTIYFANVKNKIELELLNVSQGYSPQHSFAIILGEVGGVRRLPIVIGAIEAQSILIALENTQPARPFTHDLLKNVLDIFDIVLKEIHIYKLYEGVFYANLICISNGYTYEIDSRTSDAIALAIRQNAPIFIDTEILDRVGIVLPNQIDELAPNNPEEEYELQHSNRTQKMSLQELEQLLENALQNEDYEKAAKIRDEINKIQSNTN